MNTTKIFFAFLLVLLCTATIAQQNSNLFAAAIFSPEMNRVETWVYFVNDRNSDEVFAQISLPHISHTFYTEYAEISYDEAFVETGPYMEDWMSDPFAAESVEENLSLEPWMAMPFEAEEIILLEDWMTSANW